MEAAPVVESSDHPEKRKFPGSEELGGADGYQEGTAEKKQATDRTKNGDAALSSLVPSITINMDCPPDKVGSVIGKKGITINEIMKRSGCKIVIDQAVQPARVVLTGAPESLGIAMSLVTQVINEKIDVGSTNKISGLFGAGKKGKTTTYLPSNIPSAF
jgi:polyribonucleotide nucleotidyltransferase